MKELPAQDAKVKVPKAQLQKALKALTEISKKRRADGNDLLGHSETVNLLFSLSRTPEKATQKPLLIPLPHPMYDKNSDVCIFVKDPQKKYKELFESKPVEGVGTIKVISVSKLKKNYRQADDKRTLADAYDLFLCDGKIMENMPTLLGAIFYQKRKKKIPIPIRLGVQDPSKSILEAARATTLKVPEGPSIGVGIGRGAMEADELVENAKAVIAAVTGYFAKRNNPVLTINVQATDTMALPVWRRADAADVISLRKHGDSGDSSAASETGSSYAHSDTDRSALSSMSEASAMSEASGAEQSGVSEASESDDDVPEKKPAATKMENSPLVNGLKKKRKLGELGAPKKKAKK